MGRLPAAPAGEQDRHLVGLVPVAVEQVRAAHQQGVVEQGALALGDRLQAADEVGELGDVVLVRLQVHRLARAARGRCA